jgi:hypothetical protein
MRGGGLAGGSRFFTRLNFPAFIVAFAIGVLACYCIKPAPRLIIKHPTPFNAGKVVYHDRADTCYKYAADKVQCDGRKVSAHPVEEFYAKNVSQKNKYPDIGTVGRWTGYNYVDIKK